MRISVVATLIMSALIAHAEERCRLADEGFMINIPESWKKIKVKGIDSHVGQYSAETMDMHFDEVSSLLCSKESARSFVGEMKKKEADRRLLESGEEIWHVDGKIARFRTQKVDPEVYGERRFSNVASLEVAYEDEGGSLSIDIFYKNPEDLPTVRKVLQSITWKKDSSKAVVEPTGNAQPEGPAKVAPASKELAPTQPQKDGPR